MENVSASTATYENSVTVIKSATPNFVELTDEGMPLRPLPYQLEIRRGQKCAYSIQEKQYNKNTYSIQISSAEGVVYTIPPKSWSPIISSVRPIATPLSIIGIAGDPMSWPECATAMTKMSNGLLAKVQGQSLPILMALKERKQTASLLRDTIQRLYNGIRLVRHPKRMFVALRNRAPTALELRRLRRIERRLVRRKLRKNESWSWDGFHFEQAFLEYRFAWGPLIKDVGDMLNGAAKAAAKGITKSAKKGISFNLEKRSVLKYFSSQVDPGCEFSSAVSIVGHMKVFYMIDDASLALFSQMQGIAATIWDAVSLSFLVDGLVNISKYLDLLDATMGVKFSDGYMTTLMRSYAKVNNTPWFRSSSSGKLDGSDGAVLYRYANLFGTSIHLKMNRQLLTDFPTPVLEYPYRDFVTVQRVADIGALIVQAGRRLF